MKFLGDDFHRLLFHERREVFIALQFPAAVAGELTDNGFGDPSQKEDGGRHVAQVMNSEVLDAGAFAGLLKGLSDVPQVLLLPLEADISPVGRK
jgi:hypothetical protein